MSTLQISKPLETTSTTYERKPKSEVAHLTTQMLVKCPNSFTTGLMNLLTTIKIFNIYIS
jgi:hypothetical protein